MRALLVLVLLFSAPAFAQRDRCRSRDPRVGCGSAPLFSFAPPSGAGLPVAQTLCSRLTAAQLDGGWCINGDGTMAAGSSFTLAQIGTPDGGVSTVTTCPNGSNCAAVSAIVFTPPGSAEAGKWGYEATATTILDGGLSACCLVRLSNAGVEQNILSLAESDSDMSLLWQASATGETVATFIGGGAVRRNITGLTNNARHYICATASAGRSTGQAYLDGAAFGAAYVPNTTFYSAQSWRVGGYGTGAYTLGASSMVEGCFVIPEELSAATIAADAHAVLADNPTSTKGVALTCTRASASSCGTPYDTEASVTDLPPNRCCIAGGPAGTGALARYGAYTEEALRTSEFDNNTVWPMYGTLARNGTNVALAPNGTMTAERWDLTQPAPGGFAMAQQSMASATTRVGSVYLRGVSTSGVVPLTLHNGTTCYTTVCSVTTTSWSRCYVKAGGAVSYLQIGTDERCAGQAATPSFNFYLWRANSTNTDRLVPSADATSAAVNVAATAAQFAAQDLSRMETQGCVAVTYSPTGAAAATVGDGLFFLGANGRVLYRTTDAYAKAYDGTNTPAHAVTWAANTPVRLANRWSGTTSTLYDLIAGTSTAGTYDGTWGFGATSTIDVGYTATSTTPEGWLYDLQADPNPSRCR